MSTKIIVEYLKQRKIPVISGTLGNGFITQKNNPVAQKYTLLLSTGLIGVEEVQGI